MRLYRIRRKIDGKFFHHLIAPWTAKYRGKSSWDNFGSLFKRIETICWHLENLSSDWDTNGCCRMSRITRRIKKRHPEKLKLYEVVVNDVTIKGEEVISAAALMKKRKKP